MLVVFTFLFYNEGVICAKSHIFNDNKNDTITKARFVQGSVDFVFWKLKIIMFTSSSKMQKILTAYVKRFKKQYSISGLFLVNDEHRFKYNLSCFLFSIVE